MRRAGRPRYGRRPHAHAGANSRQDGRVELPAAYVRVDLGLGPAPYAAIAVPGPDEIHPHQLGFNWTAGQLLPDRLAAFQPTEPRHWRMPARAAIALRVERHAFETDDAFQSAADRREVIP